MTDNFIARRVAEVEAHLLSEDPRKLGPAGRLLRKAVLIERGVPELHCTTGSEVADE